MNPGTNAESELDRIKNRIAHIVKSSFDGNQEVVYLSHLGNVLGADRIVLEELTNMKLAAYMRQNFDYDIDVTGPHKNILYIARPGGKTFAPPASSPPTYVSWFWAAFAKPLPPDETVRFINLDTCVFGPAQALLTAHTSGDVRRIAPEFIAPPDASGSSFQTAERIARWIELEGLDSKRFLVERKRPALKSDNLLASLINALSGEQLKRISLPLDVIKTLSDRQA